VSRNNTGMVLQFIAVAVGAYLLVTYSQVGKDLLNSCQGAIAGIELRRIADTLDVYGSDYTGDRNSVYPADYDGFRKLLAQSYPDKQDPWKDHWDNGLWYWSYTTEDEEAGYYLGSAGPDGKWKTKDDIWCCRFGNKRWTENLSWFDSKKQNKAEQGTGADASSQTR
jgi:hypothetical protein